MDRGSVLGVLNSETHTHTHTPFFQELCSSGRGARLLRAVLIPGVLARGIRSIFCCEVYRHACRKSTNCMSALPIQSTHTHTYTHTRLCTCRFQGSTFTYTCGDVLCGIEIRYSIMYKSNVVRHVSDLVDMGNMSSALTEDQ